VAALAAGPSPWQRKKRGGMVLAAVRDVEGPLAEIRRFAPERWAWGLIVYASVGVRLDNPELEPIDIFRCDRGRYDTQVSPGTPPAGCRDSGEQLKLRLMRI
jgi:hypothetical protein